MIEKKRIEWKEVSRRGTSQPILTLDAVLLLYKEKIVGRAHGVRWNPDAYRQFDHARWFIDTSWDGYQRMLQDGERKRTGFLLRSAREFERRITAHRRFVDQYKKVDFAKKSREELIDIFLQWFDLTKRFWSFAYDYIFINKFLPEQVATIIEQKVPDVMARNEYLGVLFTADRFSEQWHEKKAMLGLAGRLRSRQLRQGSPTFYRLMSAHLRSFAHLGYYYFRGEPYSAETIKKRLTEYLVLSSKQFKMAERDIREQLDNNRQTKKLMQQLRLDAKTAHSIRTIKRWGSMSNYVDETYGYAVHQLAGLWGEIRKRLGGITLREMASFRAQEIVRYLRQPVAARVLKAEAKRRLHEHVFLLQDGKISLLVGQRAIAYRRQEKHTKVSYGGIIELKGQAVSPGNVQGTVRVVYSIHDLGKVERGNIMVTDATNPTYVPAMERAAAIVTDEGGLLCHAAIVSRELKTPCVVGTEIGTRVLKDGDRVEVDAHHGIVRKLMSV